MVASVYHKPKFGSVSAGDSGGRCGCCWKEGFHSGGCFDNGGDSFDGGYDSCCSVSIPQKHPYFMNASFWMNYEKVLWFC